MAAAQAELAIERECTAEARGLIQARNTKISRLDKRLDALKTAKAEGTTIVIIAHRPSVLAFVDKMLVLRDGMVEMFGDRNEVMGKLTRAVPATAGAAGQIQASDGNQALSGGAK